VGINWKSFGGWVVSVVWVGQLFSFLSRLCSRRDAGELGDCGCCCPGSPVEGSTAGEPRLYSGWWWAA
jgi:hypothetical protein